MIQILKMINKSFAVSMDLTFLLTVDNEWLRLHPRKIVSVGFIVHFPNAFVVELFFGSILYSLSYLVSLIFLFASQQAMN